MSKIDVVKYRNIPLNVVFERFGCTISKRDPHKWNTDKGHISCPNGYLWYCHESKGGAGALDLAMFLGDMSFKEAVEFLDGDVVFSRTTEDVKKNFKPEVELVVPASIDHTWQKVYHYLSKVRKLPDAVIKLATTQNRVYSDDRGNCVFVYGWDAAKPAAIELRGTYVAKPFHKLVDGSDKTEPFLVKGGEVKVMAVGEAPISVLSYLALNPGITVAATAGAGRELPKAVIEKYHEMGYTVISINDNDSAGEKAYDWLCENLSPDIPLFRDAPTVVNDWNDVLKNGGDFLPA